MARRRRKTSRAIRIEGWDLDEANIEELEAHGVSIETLDQVAEEEPRFRGNKKQRAATHQMIGPDLGGQMWAICIVETFPFIWRPVTGWRAVKSEVEWWRKSR